MAAVKGVRRKRKGYPDLPADPTNGDRQDVKMGRPTVYSDELAEIICVAMMAGHSLKRICTLENMPVERTVYSWLAKPDHAFREHYTRAREIQAERMADELLEIADDMSNDVSGELKMPNAVAVQRSRVMIDTRKWIASKLLPKKYGDKVAQEHTGPDGRPIEFRLTRILVPDRISTVLSDREVKPDFGDRPESGFTAKVSRPGRLPVD